MAKGGQGQSAQTVYKERRIGAALAVGMKIASHHFAGRGFGYYHLDANAGSGWNADYGVPGSPVMFWDIQRDHLRGMEPWGFFCDKDTKALVDLQGRLAGRPDGRELRQSMLVPGDNSEALMVFTQALRRCGERSRFVIGSVLIDPNGYFYETGVPVALLGPFCREFPRIDLILNINLRTYRMQRSHGHAVLPPRDVLRSLGKAHWLVAEAIGRGTHFLTAIGRNVLTEDHRSLGFYASESVEGRRILDGLNRGAQIARQQTLPGLQGILGTPGFPGGARSSNAASRLEMPMWQAGDRGASPRRQVPPVGDVRRAVQPQAGLSRLPLFGAQQG